jgi:hypothetical protein
MTRQQKYPETSTFHYFNANPKNRKTGDCAIRAIATATGIAYNDVVMKLAKIQCDSGYEPTMDKGLELFMDSIGWIKHRQPRHEDNTKFTGKEFCTYLSVCYKKDLGNIIADIGGHHMVAIVPSCLGDGINDRFKVFDIWDSTDGCIGNYWTKAGVSCGLE